MLLQNGKLYYITKWGKWYYKSSGRYYEYRMGNILGANYYKVRQQNLQKQPPVLKTSCIKPFENVEEFTHYGEGGVLVTLQVLLYINHSL